MLCTSSVSPLSLFSHSTSVNCLLHIPAPWICSCKLINTNKFAVLFTVRVNGRAKLRTTSKCTYHVRLMSCLWAHPWSSYLLHSALAISANGKRHHQPGTVGWSCRPKESESIFPTELAVVWNVVEMREQQIICVIHARWC